MPQSTIETLPIRLLRPNPKNVRTHSKRQISQIADSIRQFGFNAPIVVDETYGMLAGHGRLLAAQQIGLEQVPAVVVSGLSPAQRRAFTLADNKIAENAGWDFESLALELADLGSLLSVEGLDIALTGFAAAEIDSLKLDYIDREDDPADEPVEIDKSPVSRVGEVWRLGRHRVACGDARNAAVFDRLMVGETAAMVVADPPYNVSISSVQGRGRTKHREFVAGAGEMSEKEYVEFLVTSLSAAARHSADGSIHFVFMDWRHIGELLAAGRGVYSELKNLIVWAKTNAGQGTFYRSQHELIFVFKNGKGEHQNHFGLGQRGRNRSNVWTYAGVNGFRAGRLDDLRLHPTVKPVALVADAMRDCSKRGDIVLDPFLGSGTTILAAERVGRRGFGLELDPLYVDAAVRRWQAFTKSDAFQEDGSATFDEIAASRSRAASGTKP